jgi:hypothetical protein
MFTLMRIAFRIGTHTEFSHWTDKNFPRGSLIRRAMTIDGAFARGRALSASGTDLKHYQPQAQILIEMSWGPRASVATYSSFASRSLIDEPPEFADRPNPRSRYSTAALPDCTENRRFFLAGHQKRDTPATLQHGVGHGDANLGAPVGDSRHPVLALVERRPSRK